MATSPPGSGADEIQDGSDAVASHIPWTYRLLFALTVFLSAFLLFLLEPLFAKLILPWFGGSAAVWATCLVFFQSALLLGYLYADTTTRRLASNRKSALHVLLLLVSLFWLPIAPQAFWRTHVAVDPAWRILGLLTFSIGPPFILLSATSPLVQAWYARRSRDRSPYHLFALSNTASLLALLSFPFLIERRLSSHHQVMLWSIGYLLFVACCTGSAWISWRGARAEMQKTAKNGSKDPPLLANSTELVGSQEGRAEARPYNVEAACVAPNIESDGSLAAERHDESCTYNDRADHVLGWRAKMLWLALAACGSMMLLSVTNHLTENVAPVPLLWVIPLALYLLSFAMVFAKRRLYSRWFVPRLLAVFLGGAGYAIYDSSLTHAIQISMPLFCSTLFVACLFFHGELAQRKPPAQCLTSFYLIIALGGAVGAVCIGLLAPHVLSGVYEFPIVLLLTALLGVLVLWEDGISARIFWAAMTAAMCVVLVLNVRTTRAQAVVMVRSFYGALRVRQSPSTSARPDRVLFHGTISHGAQSLSFPENRNPTTYYGRKSGVGLALRFCCDGPKRVGVIGLGAGTLAAYGKAGDSFLFYEINPQVVAIANGWFTFLKQSPAKTEIILGDARLSLESEAPQNFDVLAIDAFSGDAIPVHLLTREAFAIYFRHLKPEGILAVHTSNTYLNLAPVVKLLAEDADYATRLIASDDDAPFLISAADWVLVTRNQQFLNIPDTFAGSQNIDVPANLRLWTDDDNSLFEILRPISYQLQGEGGS